MDDIDKTLPAGPEGRPLKPQEEAQVEQSREEEAAKLPVGTTIAGEYRIKGFLDKGGMGDVYLAEQKLGVGTKEVALKIMRSDPRMPVESILRFQEEAYAGGTLQTSYVAEVYASGKVPATGSLPELHYLVMEYCGRGALTSYIASKPGGRLSGGEAVRLLRQAAEGLLAAEKRCVNGKLDPLVHRDIKPANLLLQERGGTDEVDLRIADFGSVKRHSRKVKLNDHDIELSRTGTPLSPRYASPEQWELEEVDHRSDMYSLGATFFHALTGECAAPKGKMRDIRKFTVNATRLSPRDKLEDVSEDLSRVIEKMTARQPAARYKSFEQVIQQLKLIDDSMGILRDPPVKGRVVAVLAVAIVAIALLFMMREDHYSVAGQLAEYKKLEQRVGKAQSREWLRALPTISAQLDAIKREIQTARRGLQAEFPQDGGDVAVPQSVIVERAKVGSKVEELVKVIDASREPLQALEAVESSYKKMSTDEALDKLQAVAEPEGVRTIRERKAALRDQIEALGSERKGVLDVIEADFFDIDDAVAAISRDLEEIDTRIDEFKKREGACEPDLVVRAKSLQESIGVARRLEKSLVTWPSSGNDSPARALRELIDALKKTQDLEATTRLARKWWRKRRDVLAKMWKPHVLRFISSEKDRYRDQKKKLSALPANRRRDEIRTKLRPQHDKLSSLFSELRQAIVADESSSLFRSRDQLAICSVANAGARPVVDVSVAELTREYRSVQRLVAPCRAAVSELDPSDSMVHEIDRLKIEADAAIAALGSILEPRIPELLDHNSPADLRNSLVSLMRTHLYSLAQKFRRDELDLSKAAVALASCERARLPDDCVSLAKSLRASAARASELLKAYPAEIASGRVLTEEFVESFKNAVGNLNTLVNETIAIEDVDTWRRTRCAKALRDIIDSVRQRLPFAEQGLRKLVEKLQSIAPDVKSVDEQRGIELIRDLEQTLERMGRAATAPRKPTGWSEPAWKLWPQKFTPPQKLKTRVHDGRLVAWFDFRKRQSRDGKQRPVEMLLVRPDGMPPFLVDVHEVCVGELLAIQAIQGANRDPGGYVDRRESQWKKIYMSPETLLSWTSKRMAKGFARDAYAESGLALTLPTPAQWRALQPSSASTPRDEVSDPAEVKISRLDEYRGLLGLRSGLAEWVDDGTSDGKVAGSSDYRRASLAKDYTWKEGVGFRCVLTLK